MMHAASNRAREDHRAHDAEMAAVDFLAHRKALKLTQVQLAAALGLTSTSIARMERGEQTITMRTKLALRALRVTRGV